VSNHEVIWQFVRYHSSDDDDDYYYNY